MSRARMTGSYVCSACLEDEDLKSFIETCADGAAPECSFCGAAGEGVSACRFTELMVHVKSCIEAAYDLAANNLSWESSEGGWLGARYWDTHDLLRERIGIGLPKDHDDSLFQAMCCYLGHTDWCEANPYGESQLERLRFDWEQFTAIVKHHTRFFLNEYRQPKDPVLASGRASPSAFLKAIGSAARRLELFAKLPPNTTLYRVRFHGNDQPFTSPGQLGPPPEEGAFISNRMSPPGIVMFYGAVDQETGLAETCKAPGGYSIGRFRTLRELQVLDLTHLPEVPGFFASEPDSREWSRHEAAFFDEFVADLTQPIDRDDRVHLEYVPTPVIVEYFRRQFHRDFEGEPLEGVLYPSARQRGRAALVLFCDRSFVVSITDDDEFFGTSNSPKWLELTGAEAISVTPAMLAEFAAHDSQERASAFSGLAD
jgi:hypothetical protein